MTRLHQYQDMFPHIAIDRTPTGILTMRLHRDGGPAKWAALEGSLHEQVASSGSRPCGSSRTSSVAGSVE